MIQQHTPRSAMDSGPTTAQTRRYGLLFYSGLFIALFACYGYFVQGLGPNEYSRYNLVRAIVDERTLNIDRYYENTMDKAFFNGHYYSDKAFGLSFLATPVYAVVRAFDGLTGAEERNDFGMVYFLVLFTVALPSAITGLLIARMAIRLVPNGSPVFAALAYGLGTIAFPFATAFFGHQTAATFAFAAASLLILARLDRRGPRWSLAAGLLAGMAVLVEYPVAIIAALLLAYTGLALRDWRHVAAFVAGGVPAIVALATYNYAAFGTPLAVSYSFVNDPAFAAGRVGFMGITLPNLETAFKLVFAGRGLLVNTPVLLLAVYGIYRLWRGKEARPEALLFSAVGISFFLYNAGFWLPFGGMTPGPRLLLPAFPFLAVPLAAAFGKNNELRTFGWSLALWSMFVMSTATLTGPLVHESRDFPLLEAWLPNLASQHFVYNVGIWHLGLKGAESLIPLVGLAGLGLVLLWRGSAVPAEPF